MSDFILGDKKIKSRLLIGTGKFPQKETITKAVKSSESEIITLALRRVDLQSAEENILSYIPDYMTLLPNTSGARNATEAVRIAHLSEAMGCGNWVKIEVISDQKYLLPDNEETLKATRILVKEGFVVLPYISPDLMTAKKLVDAGAAAVMPLGSPIGSNRGIRTKEICQIIINEIDIPVIIDAGIGAPSDAAMAMEMGADAVLVNTAIASAENPDKMAEAFKLAVQAGRIAFTSKLGAKSEVANPSSPLTGFLNS